MACQAAAVEEKMTLGSWTGNQKTEVVVVVEAAVADGAGHDGWCGYDCDYLALVVWYVCQTMKMLRLPLALCHPCPAWADRTYVRSKAHS